MLPFNSWSLSYYSCDRLLAIRKPWCYRNHVTRSHAIKQMSFVWAMSVIISGIEVASLYFTTANLIFRLLGVGWYLWCLGHNFLSCCSIDCKCASQGRYGSVRWTYAHRLSEREGSSKLSLFDSYRAVSYHPPLLDCTFRVTSSRILI